VKEFEPRCNGKADVNGQTSVTHFQNPRKSPSCGTGSAFLQRCLDNSLASCAAWTHERPVSMGAGVYVQVTTLVFNSFT